jgi:glycosyltransferase involved in cell wall biosynthesis
VRVSLITVTFNSQSTLQDTIDSVAKQNYKNIEYIVIDGNSKDGTVEIIKNNCHIINKWISEPDKGLYDAMNKGINMATGDIVGIINSDDFYNSRDAISSIVDGFESDEEIQSVFADVRFVKNSDLTKTVRYYSSKKFKPSLFKWGFMPAHPTFFVKKECFGKYGLYKTDYKIAADYELLIRFLYVNRIKYKYIPKDLIVMRLGGASTKSWKSNVLLNKEIIRGCKENGINTNFFILSFKYLIKVFELIKTR